MWSDEGVCWRQGIEAQLERHREAQRARICDLPMRVEAGPEAALVSTS